MQFEEKKIFEKVIKNGKYLLIHPILSVFLLQKINCEKNLSLNLVGTLVKKKKIKKSVHRNRIKRLLKASFFFKPIDFEKSPFQSKLLHNLNLSSLLFA
jgi:RNase P protein component